MGRAVVVFVMRERGSCGRERHEVMHVVPYYRLAMHLVGPGEENGAKRRITAPRRAVKVSKIKLWRPIMDSRATLWWKKCHRDSVRRVLN